MQADIAIGPNGEVTVITREGTFQGGVEKIAALVNTLKNLEIDIKDVKVEQHRHDDEKIHIHRGCRQMPETWLQEVIEK